MSTVFKDKLDSIFKTVDLVFDHDQLGLVHMMNQCSSLPIHAVGSGGSMIVAEFLAQTRAQLGHAMTNCITPMAYVLGASDDGSPSWFFSASGENQDIRAAFQAGLRNTRDNLFTLTNAREGALSSLARNSGSALYVSPVADAKDGFLATHSVISGALALVLAGDRIAGKEQSVVRQTNLRDRVAKWLCPAARAQLGATLGPQLACDTLILLHDPQLAAAATLIETSAWEAGLCSVQRTDFRNFAHGRHVWLDKHPTKTFLISIFTEQSKPVWDMTDASLPAAVARAAFSFHRAGRASQLEGISFGLAFVEALGAAKGVDPGKPGVAEFGRRLFDDSVLRNVVAEDLPSVRRKRRAAVKVDSEPSCTELSSTRASFVKDIESSVFGALVLDYDGTVVATDKRFAPPAPEIIAELRRLIDGDIRVGFASGRGGSIGEALRVALPEAYHSQILIGYFNGALIQPLDVDIRNEPIASDSEIVEARRRLMSLAGLFRNDWAPKDHGLQLTIDKARLSDEFKGTMWMIEALADLNVQILQSGHSIDIFPRWASKRDVVARLRESISSTASATLCIGDRGERFGNDHDLLEGPHGVSVGRVCDRYHTCWNLAPDDQQGPLGLKTLLASFKVVSPGAAKLTVPISFSFG
jgi:hydroxymethylpyrimidine pyrophosphatase-like HAD family hydrolase